MNLYFLHAKEYQTVPAHPSYLYPMGVFLVCKMISLGTYSQISSLCYLEDDFKTLSHELKQLG